MLTGTAPQENKFSLLLAESRLDPVRMSLLDFWSRHRVDRYTISTMYYALDFKRWQIKQALDQFVADGLLNTCNESGVCFYSLTGDEIKRSMLLEFVTGKGKCR